MSQSPSINMIFNGRYPSEKAASLFAANSAESFANQGLETRIFVPRRLGVKGNDPYSYYHVKKNFLTIYLPVVDLFSTPYLSKFKTWGFLSFYICYASFTISIVASFIFRLITKDIKTTDIVYSNEWLPLWALSFIFKNTFYEMHDFPNSFLRVFGLFIRKMKWVLIHNRWKSEQAIKIFRLNPGKILCRSNSVDIKAFDIPLSKLDARKQLSLPLHEKIIVYTGHMYGWKGVDTLAEAALLSTNMKVFYVGGTANDIRDFTDKYSSRDGYKEKIFVVGHQPHNIIPVWQKASDVLVIPNTAKEDISLYYTSPMKLFEYMASSRPIVASRIPSICEIVDDNSAILVEPDNPEELKKGIVEALTDNDRVQTITKKAFERVKENTWDERAKKILSFAGVIVN